MKIALISVMHNPEKYFNYWYEHYKDKVDDIYIIEHIIPDRKRMKRKSGISYSICKQGLYRDPSLWPMFVDLVSDKIKSLNSKFDYFLIADHDEFIFTSDKHKDIKDLIKKLDYPELITTTGYQLRGSGKDLPYKNKKLWEKDTHYNKVSLVTRPHGWRPGFHATDEENCKDLYLVHCKHWSFT